MPHRKSRKSRSMPNTLPLDQLEVETVYYDDHGHETSCRRVPLLDCLRLWIFD